MSCTPDPHAMWCGAVGIMAKVREINNPGSEISPQSGGSLGRKRERRKAINDQHLSTLLMTGGGVYPLRRLEGQSHLFMWCSWLCVALREGGVGPVR